MANKRAAEKFARQSAKRRLRNRIRKSRMKTLIRKFDQAIQSGDRDLAVTLYRQATSAVDKAAKKGAIHRNKADRAKSQLALKLNALSA